MSESISVVAPPATVPEDSTLEPSDAAPLPRPASTLVESTASSSTPLPSTTGLDSTEAPKHATETEPGLERFAGTESDAARAAMQASQFNKLLTWNRRTRIATKQDCWDWSTATYHVPRQSEEYYSNVTRLPGDPNAPPQTTANGTSTHQPRERRYPTSITVSSNPHGGGGKDEFDSDGEPNHSNSNGQHMGGNTTLRGYHDSGRPKRSRQAMTRN
ncbi:uncharacterized protein JCM15063_006449 [Sporobolomyces koalae]|uniref:uncharacterized protein n=1 Tax=Sporobolomyces koalae TaxID=500713 RepID=UPI00316D01E1